MSNSVSRDEVRRLAEQGACIVEVLPPVQYRKQHLAGAINIPLTKLASDTAARLPREKAVIVYCEDAL